LTTNDSDLGDGFNDSEECTGISIYQTGYPVPGLEDVQYPRQERLDPATKDLFVIVVPATDIGYQYSYIPVDPLYFVSRSKLDGGLEVVTHPIIKDQVVPERWITYLPYEKQKAVRVTESLSTSNPNVMGSTMSRSTPNNAEPATVYTQNIINKIEQMCSGASYDSNCKDSTGTITGREQLRIAYTKHTIAHEIGHMVFLTPNRDRTYDYHYKPGTNSIMDYEVKYTTKSGKVTLYLGTKFTSADQAGFALK
jgi:hypothetical protein